MDTAAGPRTFVFTDIEGSTRRWEQYPESMEVALAHHDQLLATPIAQRGGVIFKHMGDGTASVFADAGDALEAAAEIQRDIAAADWSAVGGLSVRIGVHTGTAQQRDDDWFGPTINRCARLTDAGHGGQVLVSIATRSVLERVPDGLQLTSRGHHRLKDLSGAEEIFQLYADGLRTEFPALRTLDATPNNLPLARTSFIGRSAERKELAELIDKHHLITLTGSGGTGKTRLATHTAADLLHRFPGGVFLADLTTIADPELIPQSVAESVGLRMVGSTGRGVTDELVGHLAHRTALIVLDNCEHVLDAVADLVDAILAGCPDTQIIVTSREPLGLEGEQVWRVPPLQLDSDNPIDATAVRLFADRASAVDRSFELNDYNTEAVVEICRRLDGIPLAIELASARIVELSAEELLERLDDRFRLLTGDRRGRGRKRTLHATLEWSWDLLTTDEQELLARLSVFSGPFTLEAVEQICFEPDDRRRALDDLRSLIDKSMVDAALGEGAMRYRLLESVRLFAYEKLEERDETDTYRTRHRDWYLTWAEGIGGRPTERGLIIDATADNMRLALDWSRQRGDGVEAARLAVATSPMWIWLVRPGEGQPALEAAAEFDSQLPAGHRVARLAALAALELINPRYPQVYDIPNAAIDADPDGTSPDVLLAYFVRAQVDTFVEPASALKLLATARSLPATTEHWQRAQIGQLEGTAHLLAGDAEEARRCYRSLVAAEDRGEIRLNLMLSYTFVALSVTEFILGDDERAAAAADTATDRVGARSLWFGDLSALCVGVLPAIRSGDAGAGWSRLHDALDLAESSYGHVDNAIGLPATVAAIAAHLVGESEEAALLATGVTAQHMQLRSEYGATLYEACVPDIKEAVGKDGWASAGRESEQWSHREIQARVRALIRRFVQSGP